MRRTSLAAAMLAFLASTALARAGDEAAALPKATAVSFPTPDKKTVVGRSWGAASLPVVLLLGDESEKRGAFDAVVGAALSRRLSVVEVDLRAGDGTIEDAVAAVRGLRAGAKATQGRRVGLLAVGARAAAALEAARRHPDDVSAVACLGPTASDAALSSTRGLSSDTPVLFAARAVDADGAKKLHAAVVETRKGAARATLRVLEKPPAIDGAAATDVGPATEAIRSIPLLDAYLAGFFARELGTIPNEPLLDGDVSVEGSDGGAWTRAVALSTTQEGGRAWAYRVDRRVVLGGHLPSGVTMLHLRLKASSSSLDWKSITGSPIAPAKIPHQFLDCVIEAPTGKLRSGNAQVMSSGGAFPSMRPGAMPSGPPRGIPEMKSPFRLAFVPHAGGWSFEGELTVSNVDKVRNLEVSLAWGWLQGMPPMPNMSMRPWMDWDLSGPWTVVPTR